MNGSVKHVFHNKYARQAALKAATKGYTNIRIYTSGSAVPGSAAIERDKMIERVSSRKPKEVVDRALVNSTKS